MEELAMSISKKGPLPVAKPEEMGLSSKGLARIGPAMQKYIDRKMVPNVTTLVAREGKIVHYEARGYMDLKGHKPIARDTIYRLYSNSKPIAGLAILILYEDGLLTLDDPVSMYIPAFKNQMVVNPAAGLGRNEPPGTVPLVPTKREITIRDCLRNTTGLATPQRTPYAIARLYQKYVNKSGWNLDANLYITPKNSFRERIEAHARIPLSFQPGTDFEYHVGYPAIGVIIEEITGRTLEEFYQERIFKPLHMEDTSFYLNEECLDRFPTCYRSELKDGSWNNAVLDKPETSEKLKGPKVFFAAGGDMGGILSTAEDYARFAQLLLNNGELDGVRLLGRKSVELMTANHTKDILTISGPGFGFGLGVGVYKGGSPLPIMRSIGTFGWSGAAGTTFFADPKEKLLAICFTQVINHMVIPGNSIHEEFEKLVYQSLL